MKAALFQIKRIGLDVILSVVLLAVFLSGYHLYLPNAAGLLAMKMNLVSLGLTHAHLFGKLAFPSVDWKTEKYTPLHVLRMALYVVMPYLYCIAG